MSAHSQNPLSMSSNRDLYTWAYCYRNKHWHYAGICFYYLWHWTNAYVSYCHCLSIQQTKNWLNDTVLSFPDKYHYTYCLSLLCKYPPQSACNVEETGISSYQISLYTTQVPSAWDWGIFRQEKKQARISVWLLILYVFSET